MRQGKPEITEAELLAYADGKSDPAQATRIAAWLALHPARETEVSVWQRQNDALRALFGTVANEVVPERLRPRTIAARQAAHGGFRLPQLAAAMLLLALGAGLGWGSRVYVERLSPVSDTLIDSAVTAHALYVRENRHAVEVAASDGDHLVSWLSNRIEQPISTPDLSLEGFALVGGRLLPPGGAALSGPAAQLMYENAAAERVTVYITAALPQGDAAYEFTTVDALEAFYWANDKITCTVVGDLPEAQMQAVARKVYQQLTRRPDTRYLRG